MTEGLPNTLLPTTLVGSYPQPDWLIDRRLLAEIVPPRARARELWRVEAAWLEQAQDDATLLAIRDQERAGIDVVTDGEMRRESYSNRFATALEGVDSEHPAKVPSRTPGRFQIVPRVVGPIRRRQPVQARDVAFLRANTDRPIKITIPGPFTMTQQLRDEHYHDEAALALDCAAALNAEIRDLFAAGADVVQLDEPFLQARPEAARRFGVPAIDRAVDGVGGTTGAPPLLRLRGTGEGQTVRLFVPARTCGFEGRPDLDRGCRAEARLRDPGTVAGQADHPGRARSRRYGSGNAGARR
jgi:5-methyltetrahydropteroyltriglutamate--homocysteine methyltransferase